MYILKSQKRKCISGFSSWKYTTVWGRTHSMLCKNSPFGRLNFFILSADADAKVCLEKRNIKTIIFMDEKGKQTLRYYVTINHSSIISHKERMTMYEGILFRMSCHCPHRFLMVCESCYCLSCRTGAIISQKVLEKMKNKALI